MPRDLPAQFDIDAALRALTETRQPNAVITITQLIEASRSNFNELNAAIAQSRILQQQLAQAENALAESKIRYAEVSKHWQDLTAQTVKLESELRLAQAQLNQSGSEIASLQKTIADLQDRLKAATSAAASKTIADMVGELRADAAQLFAKPFRAAESPTKPGVVIDGLDFEIRGGLVIGDKIGLRAFAADNLDPAAASILRFSLRPEMRVEVPEDSTK